MFEKKSVVAVLLACAIVPSVALAGPAAEESAHAAKEIAAPILAAQLTQNQLLTKMIDQQKKTNTLLKKSNAMTKRMLEEERGQRRDLSPF